MVLLSKKVIHEIYIYIYIYTYYIYIYVCIYIYIYLYIYICIYKNRMEKRALSRELKLKLRRVRYWKCQQNFLLSPKNLSFLRSVKLNSSTIFALLYMHILYVYIWIFYVFILNRWKERELWVAGQRQREWEHEKPIFICLSLLSPHVHSN